MMVKKVVTENMKAQGYWLNENQTRIHLSLLGEKRWIKRNDGNEGDQDFNYCDCYIPFSLQ
jgi:repressor of nif and glnA expression